MRAPSRVLGAAIGFTVLGLTGCDDSTGPDTSRDVVSVVVTPDTRAFTAINDSARLSADAKNSAGGSISGTTFTWSSLESNIASVDQTGMVKARAVGTARIVASASGKSDTATITVTQTATHVVLTPEADTINAIGDVVTFTAVVTDANNVPLTNPTITWSSGTPSVVSVVGGNVTSIATGSASVIATSGTVADTSVVVSRQIAATLTVTPSPVALMAGETQQLSATAADSNGVPLPAGAMSWISSAPAIASVSAAGLVRGESTGGSTVTVSAPGRSVDVSVTVHPGAPSGPLTWSVVHQGLSLSTAYPILGVMGRSATEVYAVTPPGNTYRYDGSRWVATVGSLGVPFSLLNGFWVNPNSSSIWGVGTQSRPNLEPPPVTRSGHVFKTAGSAWTTEHVGPDGTEFWDVSGTSDTDIWVSGTDIRHYDGATWTVAHGSPANGFMYTSIWAAGGTTLFAGSNYGGVRRFEGGVWVEAQSAPDNGFRVTDIWGTSANDVWVVDEGGFVRRWNGVAWSQSTRFPGPLYAVRGTSSTNVWVGGDNVLAQWSGGSWFSLDPATTVIGIVRGIDLNSATSGWLVTSSGILSELRTDGWTPHWDSPATFRDVTGSGSDAWICGLPGAVPHLTGGSWRTERLPRSEGCFSITAASSTNVIAGGVSAIYYRSNGTSWSVSPTGAPRFEDLWTTPAGQTYGVAGTTVYRFDGASWLPMPTGSPVALAAVWASGPNDIFAVGDQGTVMYYDGTSWTKLATGSTAWLRGVWGSSPTDVYAVSLNVGGLGVSGPAVILHYNGSSWSEVHSRAQALHDIHGRGPNEVYAVGDGPTVLRFNGTAWTEENVSVAGAGTQLFGVWASPAGEVYVVGHPSLILRGAR